MTVEEARARLKILTDYEYDEDLEALETAIKALEQEYSVIEELEKVKKEILEENRCMWYSADISECIDKHIAKLKGETK